MKTNRTVQFSMQQLFTAIFVLAILLISGPWLYRYLVIDYAPIDPNMHLLELGLLLDNSEVISDVSPVQGFEWYEWNVRKSIMKVQHGDKLLPLIVGSNSFQQCDHQHPSINDMIAALPRGWHQINEIDATWYKMGFHSNRKAKGRSVLVYVPNDNNDAYIYQEFGF